MCDAPVPCQCTTERRQKRRDEHIARSDALRSLASRLLGATQITEAEAYLLWSQAEQEWDDAIHIASPDDSLRSLCGHYGRNLVDLPAKPDGGSGCWTCLQRADELLPEAAAKRELVTA